MNPVCNSAACYLARQGGQVTFPLVTIAGLVDGINPCAIGMLLLLLGYVIIFAGKPEKTLKLGGVYILTIYLTYLAIGLLFYQSINLVNLSPYQRPFELGIGLVLLAAGVLNIKDFFLPNIGPSLGIPERAKSRLLKLIEKVSLPATVILAILVTLLETPCSLPIYLGTATILNYSNLPFLAILAYFLYYNFLFVLPLLVVLLLVWKGKQVMSLKEWQHKAVRWMKLSLGILLVIMAAWLLL